MQIGSIPRSAWLGVPEQPETSIPLQAGALHAEYCGGRLLNLQYHGETVVQEVYFALRDENWNTIAYTVHDLHLTQQPEAFALTFHASHDAQGIRYEWDAEITGSADSSITFRFSGLAQSEFLRNRIGFCVLHPDSCAGKRCRIIHSHAEDELGAFPVHIAPHQPCLDICAIEYALSDKVHVQTLFSGDVFEMEDQRNWTDASFKTYCTPLGLPFPVQVRPGDTVQQSVTVRISGAQTEKSAAAPRQAAPELSQLLQEKLRPPALGSIIRAPLTARQLPLIEALHLPHLRYEWHFCRPDAQRDEILSQAQNLGASLELALFFTADWEAELPAAADWILKHREAICRIAVFQEHVKVVPVKVLLAVRQVLQESGIPVGSGTDAFFAQCNREPLPREAMDFVTYSNDPQVHAFDNDSILSTTRGQAENAASCKALFPGLPVQVSPVSLRMRWNPESTSEKPLPPGTAPDSVDPRQISLFTAAWFVRSYAALAGASVAAADYFELIGPEGLMQAEQLPAYPFPAEENMAYAVYAAMRLIAGQQSTAVCAYDAQDWIVLALHGKKPTRLLFANLRPYPVQAQLPGLWPRGKSLLLDAEAMPSFAADAEQFLRGAWREQALTDTVSLLAYALYAIDEN